MPTILFHRKQSAPAPIAKEGRVLSSKNEAALRQASDLLMGVLGQLQSQEPAKAGKSASGLQNQATVFFRHGDKLVGGVVKAVAGDEVEVFLAFPDERGVLLKSQSAIKVKVSDLMPRDVQFLDVKVKRWDANSPLSDVSENGEAKAARPVKQGDVITDYLDVMISGYGSTFKETTPQDRDGDYIMPGAFTETLARFKKNPVMLADHTNKTEKVVGHWTKFNQDRAGLAMEGALTNAPDDFSRRVRFLVVERSLRTLSIGGMFLYDTDGRGVKKIELWETSIVPIPANPDALFTVKDVDIDTAAKAMSRLTGG